jgi:uncharacterized protein (DUF488 family)
MTTIYTLGYGDKPWGRFLRILAIHGITQVIDVRRFPTSQRAAYTKESLARSLPEGIQYVHLPVLGGYRKGGYEHYTETDAFRNGMTLLKKVGEKRKSVIMCVESYPSGCHRRFIAQKLEEEGWTVVHLVGKKGTIHEETRSGTL